MVDFLLTDGLELSDDGAGDIMIGDSAGQVAYLVLKTCQGEWRRYPFMGANLIRGLNAPEAITTEVLSDIDTQLNALEGLGLTVDSDGSNIIIS